jgi:ribonuclease HI
MQKKKYYYAIAKGRKIGIFDNWDEVFKHTNRYPDNSKEKFDSYVAAQNWLKKQHDSGITTDLSIPKNGYAVDGACNQNLEEFDFQVYDLENNVMIFTSRKYPDGTNNIAEFFGLMYVIKRLQNKELTNSPVVFTDSNTAITWFNNKKCKSNSINTKIQDKVSELEKWLKANDISWITVSKWQTKIWGENPADFGRK